jgi:hypothetical protein
VSIDKGLLYVKLYIKTANVSFSERRHNHKLIITLEVTIARKVLPHSQGIKEGSMRNLLNKGLFYDPALPRQDVRQDDLDLSQ